MLASYVLRRDPPLGVRVGPCSEGCSENYLYSDFSRLGTGPPGPACSSLLGQPVPWGPLSSCHGPGPPCPLPPPHLIVDAPHASIAVVLIKLQGIRHNAEREEHFCLIRSSRSCRQPGPPPPAPAAAAHTARGAWGCVHAGRSCARTWAWCTCTCTCPPPTRVCTRWTPSVRFCTKPRRRPWFALTSDDVIGSQSVPPARRSWLRTPRPPQPTRADPSSGAGWRPSVSRAQPWPWPLGLLVPLLCAEGSSAFRNGSFCPSLCPLISPLSRCLFWHGRQICVCPSL